MTSFIFFVFLTLDSLLIVPLTPKNNVFSFFLSYFWYSVSLPFLVTSLLAQRQSFFTTAFVIIKIILIVDTDKSNVPIIIYYIKFFDSFFNFL